MGVQFRCWRFGLLYVLESEWKDKHSQCLLDFFFLKKNSSQNSCSCITNCRENTEHVDF